MFFIKYFVLDNVSPSDRLATDIIRGVMDDLQNFTCLTFTEVPANTAKLHLKFTASTSSCSSYIGMIPRTWYDWFGWDGQPVRLMQSCLVRSVY